MMIINKLKFLAFLPALVVYILPFVVSAQAQPPAEGTLGALVIKFETTIVNPLVGILMTLAILAFFYGLVLYIWNLRGGKDEGKAIMVWGVVAIAVMVSVWGLVNLLQRTVLNNDVEDTYNDNIPTASELTPGGAAADDGDDGEGYGDGGSSGD